MDISSPTPIDSHQKLEVKRRIYDELRDVLDASVMFYISSSHSS